MGVFDERPGSMRSRSAGPEQFQIRIEPSRAESGPRTRSGRKLAPIDNGTVALAISGMAFYWMMPMVMGRGRRRKRPNSGNTTG